MSIDLTSFILVTMSGGALGLVLLYFVIRGAVRSAMRQHALWLASARYPADVEAHKRAAARYGEG